VKDVGEVAEPQEEGSAPPTKVKEPAGTREGGKDGESAYACGPLRLPPQTLTIVPAAGARESPPPPRCAGERVEMNQGVEDGVQMGSGIAYHVCCPSCQFPMPDLAPADPDATSLACTCSPQLQISPMSMQEG
jgi:hypothetical protein